MHISVHYVYNTSNSKAQMVNNYMNVVFKDIWNKTMRHFRQMCLLQATNEQAHCILRLYKNIIMKTVSASSDTRIHSVVEVSPRSNIYTIYASSKIISSSCNENYASYRKCQRQENVKFPKNQTDWSKTIHGGKLMKRKKEEDR